MTVNISFTGKLCIHLKHIIYAVSETLIYIYGWPTRYFWRIFG